MPLLGPNSKTVGAISPTVLDGHLEGGDHRPANLLHKIAKIECQRDNNRAGMKTVSLRSPLGLQ